MSSLLIVKRFELHVDLALYKIKILLYYYYYYYYYYYGTSICGCNNNTIFSEITICTFPTVNICWARWPGSGKALVMHAKVETASTVELIIFRVQGFLLPK